MFESIPPGVLPTSIFRELVQQYKQFSDSPSKSPDHSEKAQQLITKFENLWDYFRKGSFFSRNEKIEEYSNATLKFFLIPFYIGNFHNMIQGQTRPSHLESCSTYLTAFADEVSRLGLISEELPDPKSPAEKRERVIQDLQARKELESKLSQISKKYPEESRYGGVGDFTDEEVERTYVLDLLKLSGLEARKTSKSAKEELPFALMHSQGIQPEVPTSPPPKMWFQRIDRNQVRDKVFAPIQSIMPQPLPPDDETFASPGKPKPELDASDEEERELARIEQAKWDDWKDDHPPFSQE